VAVAETANLLVKLSLTGNYKSQITSAQRSFATLGRGITNTQGRAYKAGQQIGTGIQRGAVIAVTALTALTGLLALSVKEGQDAANVQKIYAQAISNSGKVSADYVKLLNDQQKALENLAGVDDELIKSEQTRLIQMGLNGKQVLKATPLILDFAKATGIDLLTATKLVGKATNGNAGALSRYGIAVDKAKFKTDPFAATMDALNKKFGGTTKALSGSLNVRLDAFKQALGDIREEAGIKLLPALTRIVDVAGKDLVPAFGKFIDRILPDVITGVDKFASLLENGGAAKGITAITDALGPMVDLLKIAAAPVKAIVSAFLSLPSQVQTVLIGAFAVNKLTGGLVTNVFGGIAEAIAKAVIRAPLVNVQGGVVNVNGGVGVPGGGPAPGGTGLINTIKGILPLIPLAGIVAAGQIAGEEAAKQVNKDRGTDFHMPAGFLDIPTQVSNLVQAVQAFTKGVPKVFQDSPANRNANSDPRRTAVSTGHPGKVIDDKVLTSVTQLSGKVADDTAAVSAVKAQTATSGSAITGATRGVAPPIVAAIRASTPIIYNNISISATSITKVNTVVNRYGSTSGSRNSQASRQTPI
jgi:hypothetical protein